DRHFAKWWPGLEHALKTLPPPKAGGQTPLQELLNYGRKQHKERLLREGFAVFTQADGRPDELRDVLHGEPVDQWTFLIIAPTVQLLNRYAEAERKASDTRNSLNETLRLMKDPMDPETGLNSPNVSEAMEVAGAASDAVHEAKKALADYFQANLKKFVLSE